MWVFLVLAVGLSIWGVIIAILLDAVGFWVALIYLFFLRDHVPQIFGIGIVGYADTLAKQLIIPVFVSFFLSRALTFFVAKASGYKFE